VKRSLSFLKVRRTPKKGYIVYNHNMSEAGHDSIIHVKAALRKGIIEEHC
jgi:hypothetical protein